MSVINKMLRDLDSRQTSATPVSPVLTQGRGVARGTSVFIPTGQPRKIGWMTFVAVAFVLAGLGGGLVVWWQTQDKGKTQLPATIAPPAQSAQAAVTPPIPENLAPPAVIAAVPPTLPVPKSPPLSPAAKLVLPAAPPATAAPVQATSPNTPAAPKLRVATEMALPTLSKADVPAKSTPPAPNTIPAPLPATVPVPNANAQRQAAALDALAQAQGLWTAGARDSAIEVLREAVALAERQGSGAGGALLPLARELVRMLIAENQNGQALDLLTRLEPALSSQADLWAVRGNAAQRLGRHPEAASAYAMALKLRAGEPRWMLGAAISLAIQGQLTEAGELAEQARIKGALSPELRTYLRQLGISIRD